MILVNRDVAERKMSAKKCIHIYDKPFGLVLQARKSEQR
jgi:hypothetical protein